ncbi:MAG: glycosyltransferase [Mangrovibacterium sp.]
MNITILGLSVTSSWRNDHATIYRSLIKGLYQRGHNVTFLERDVPRYAPGRDMYAAEYCTINLYSSLGELKRRYATEIWKADLVIVGSYVPDGVEVGKWVISTARGLKAFYDIDTPVTLAKLRLHDYEYIHPDLIPQYDLYLSFSGGPVLEVFMKEYGSPAAKPLYCSVDPDLYFPDMYANRWDLGYLGTYSDDRQSSLQRLMIDAALKWDAGKFVVAAPQYPGTVKWSANVERIEHLALPEYNKFYNQQRFTLSITRRDMISMGYSPSVRLFEAAACKVPVISDYWEGLDRFFREGREILIARSAADTIRYLKELTEKERRVIAENARGRVLSEHTGEHRAGELEEYVLELQEKDVLM